MCDLKDGFKLCTCDDGPVAEPDWFLRRRDTSRPELHRRGRAMVPRFTAAEQELQTRIIAALDDGSCFDFPYTPVEHDVLSLRVAERQFRFRFSQGTWQIDRSTSLTGWRSQMVEQNQGVLSEP